MKTNKEDILKTQLKLRFGDSKYPFLDDNLWTEIEKEVKAHKAKAMAKKWILTFIGSAAACAIILSLVVPQFYNTENIVEHPIIKTNTESNINKNRLATNPIEKPKAIKPKVMQKKNNSGEIDEPNARSENTVVEEVEVKIEKEKEILDKADLQKMDEILFANEVLLDNNLFTELNKKTTSKKMELALSASNVMGKNLSENNLIWDKHEGVETSAPEPIEKNIEYHLPLNFGLFVRKNITDWFAIESGLTYTYLSSTETIKSNYAYQENKLKLHYIGIPMKAIFKVYSTDRLSLYGGTGMTFEKCVSGSITGKEKHKTNLEISNIQMSALFSAGINYKIINRWGLFIEPGVSYYFDDGSSIQTIRKEKPFNINIQGGIRYTY